jgi:hypothetical protein
MTCARSTSSPVPAAVSMQTSFLDTPPCAPSSSTPTPAPCSEPAPPMDGGPTCTCTRETFGCGIHPRGRAEWIASQRASLARILASPAAVPAWPASVADSGQRFGAPSLTFDRASHSWRTPQRSLVEVSMSSSPTLPRLATMLGGSCWELMTSAPLTSASAGGALRGVPTPTAGDAKASGSRNTAASKAHPGVSLTDWVRGDAGTGRLWTTPCADDTGARTKRYAQGGTPLSMQAGGPLNPTWVEWLMRWPLGATVCTAWATGRSRSQPRRRGASSEGP